MREFSEAGKSPLQVIALVVTAGLLVILLGGWLVMSGRVKALEKDAATEKILSSKLSALSSDVEVLSAKVKSLEAKLAGIARLESEIAGLSGRIDALRKSQENPGQSTLLNELVATVRTLNSDLDKVRKLAEEAALKAAPVPPQTPSGPDPKALTALSERLDSLDARLSELAKKPSPAAPPVRINEDAVRSMVHQMVEEEFSKLREEWLEQFRRGRQVRADGGARR